MDLVIGPCGFAYTLLLQDGHGAPEHTLFSIESCTLLDLFREIVRERISGLLYPAGDHASCLIASRPSMVHRVRTGRPLLLLPIPSVTSHHRLAGGLYQPLVQEHQRLLQPALGVRPTAAVGDTTSSAWPSPWPSGRRSNSR